MRIVIALSLIRAYKRAYSRLQCPRGPGHIPSWTARKL